MQTLDAEIIARYLAGDEISLEELGEFTNEQIAWISIQVDYESDPKFHHLRRPGINFVPGNGSLKPHGVFFVGEAPGENENIQRIPFVGRAGYVWEKDLLPILGLKRKDVYITNVVKYRPLAPANRDPSPYEILSSIPYLTREINLLNPKVIVPMGRIATQTFFPDRPVNVIRGTVVPRRGRSVIPVYHPAATFYNSDLKLPLIKQFEMIRDLIS